MCSIPSTVWKRAARQPDERQQADRQVGAGPLVVQRVEAALGEALGAAHERVGARPPRGDRVVLVEPQDVQQLAARAARAARRASRSGNTSSAHTGVGHGQIVQFVVRSLTTLMPSLTAGSRSLPTQRGIEVGHQPGRARPRQRDARARAGRRARARARRTRRARSRASPARACSIRARLTWGSNQPTSTNFAPCRYALAASARTRYSLPGSQPIATIWSCCTLAPKPTTRSAKRARVASSIAAGYAATRYRLCRSRRGARVVESGGLENRCAGNRTEGSNPSPSASGDSRQQATVQWL